MGRIRSEPFRASAPPDEASRKRGVRLKAGGAGILRLLLALTLAPGVELARAQPSAESREYRLKAGFLFQFGHFVEWPPAAFETPGDSLVFGILGEDPFGAVLDGIVARERIDGRRLQVKRHATIGEIERCHVLFISRSEAERLPEILAHLKDRPILTVSDIKGFCRHGGMIGFVIRDDRIRYEINARTARDAKLEISSKVLRLATEIIGPKEKKE